jgi:hypothetical protein
MASVESEFAALERRVQQGELQSPCRSFVQFEYATLKSWSRARRVIGKAEILPQGNNPRFIVTNLPEAKVDSMGLVVRKCGQCWAGKS